MCAKAFKCDRCPAYEDGEPVVGVSLNRPKSAEGVPPGAREIVPHDLCVQCFAELTDWLAGVPDEIDPPDVPPIQGRYQ